MDSATLHKRAKLGINAVEAMLPATSVLEHAVSSMREAHSDLNAIRDVEEAVARIKRAGERAIQHCLRQRRKANRLDGPHD
ncbi:hypothetical protein [Dyella sp.]|uniref:hypothetical protein n=1 Tax=Dyella sp. TaxID=1869338 RepID=UPI002845EBF4|nr:hypothetical protein [Dyella sp.]MDR3446661.1 hypothetical protein [Dyella sp.]